MRAALITALAALLVIASPSDASAAGGKQVAQQKGPAKKARGKSPAKKPAKTSVSKKAPRKAGSEAAPANAGLRASVAGQPVSDEPTAAAGAPELREVDDVLFPELAGADGPSSSAAPEVRVFSNGLPVTTEPLASSDAPSDLKWMASLAKPDIPFRWDARLVKYLDYFKNNPKGRSFAAALVKRSGRYETEIRAAAKARGVPEDLVWVALVESGMNPKIVSPAGAAGLWQFMPKAGAAYGLRMDRWVDERLDPERSTAAGLKYLHDLHARFGSWELALAAYNMGHGALLTAVRKYNTNDFWELSQLEAGVPYETALYVPKIVALAFVARNKQVFGCDGVQPDAPEPFGAEKKSPTADSAKGDAEPARAPDKAAAPTRAKAPPPPPVESPPPGAVKHTLRWGETLEHLALATGTTESKLRSLNGFTDTVPPRPGTVLLLPRQPTEPASAEQQVAVVPGRTAAYPGKKRVFYEVVWGDRIDAVARVLGVTVEELCRWNNVDRDARLHGKMILQAFVDEKRDLADVRTQPADKTKVLVVGTTEFFDHFEAKNGRARVIHTVEQGDTLASLAKRYACSLGMLERINHRPRKSTLTAGERVVVYTTRVEAVKPAVRAKPADAIEPGSDPYDDVPVAKEDMGG